MRIGWCNLADSIELTTVFISAPQGHSRGREGLDLLMLNASYERVCAALFVGDGVYQLVAGQQPQLTGNKDHSVTFKALPLYDVERIVVCQQSLQERQLAVTDLLLADTLEIAEPSAIQTLLSHSKEILTF